MVVVTIKVTDDEVWAMFKNYVLLKHGKIRGALGYELTEVLRLFLQGALKRAEHTHTPPVNTASVCAQTAGQAAKQSRVLSELPQVKKAILSVVEPRGCIPKRMLENIIRQVCKVTDKRAVGNRINALLSEGFIEVDLNYSTKGAVYRVMGEPNHVGAFS